MSYIYVFDYSCSTITEFEVPQDDLENLKVEELLSKHGYKMSECYYMITNERIRLVKRKINKLLL